MDKINDTTMRNYSLHLLNNKCAVPLVEGAIFVTINFALAVVGTYGNLLTVFAVLKTPELRQRASNILLQNLAVADLLTTMCAQPVLATSMALKAFSHRCAHELDKIYLVVYTFSGATTNFLLISISIGRAISVLKPHQHHNIMKKTLKVMLVLSWGVALLYGSLYLPVPKMKYVIMASNVGGALVMLCAYFSLFLFKIFCSNQVEPEDVTPSTARETEIEKHISKTLAIVILLFTCSWLPVFIYYLTHPKRKAIDVNFWWIRTVYLANSSMNFIVYSCRIRRFRTAYRTIISGTFQTVMEALEKICYF